MQFTFSPMHEADARAVKSWRYEDPYAVYNMDGDPDDLAELLDRRSPHYAVRNEQAELIGFFAFGTSAQVWQSDQPTLYSENNTITVGLGMRPDLTGKGLGLPFFNAGLDFAREQFRPDHFRLFVLTFNRRATRVYERAGFQHVRVFVQRNIHGEHEFLEMSRKENPSMTSITQKDKAVQFRRLHSGPRPLVLPNAWDAASARIFEQAGFPAVATTSSGVAAALGYPDGQEISRDMLVGVVERITRVVACPVTVDAESGYGDTIEAVLRIIGALIEAGAVGINIEDSAKGQEKGLLDIPRQVELLIAIQELASSVDVPLVINARTDVYLLPTGDPNSRFEQAVQRANAYLQAGADCFFPIGASDAGTIAKLAQAIHGPVNILASPSSPSVPELAQLGVARISFGSGPMRAILGRLRRIAHELLEHGTYSSMAEEIISGAELRALFEDKSNP